MIKAYIAKVNDRQATQTIWSGQLEYPTDGSPQMNAIYDVLHTGDYIFACPASDIINGDVMCAFFWHVTADGELRRGLAPSSPNVTRWPPK